MPKRLFALLTLAVASPALAATCPVPDQAWSEKPTFARPVAGRVTKSFGMIVHPILRTTKLHTGVDFDGPIGTAVSAAAAGTVVEAAISGQYGNFVLINHGNGLATAYAHLSRIDVTPGACIGAGQKIGERGNTGLSSGPHLHFEVRRDGKPIDPAPFLQPASP